MWKDIELPGPSTEATPASETLEARALQSLRANMVSGYDPFYRVEYQYVRPSPGRYNWQWFWDSCFHAIALARLDPRLAETEIRTLMTPQDPDGFIGHMTYWGRRGALASAIFVQSKLGTWRRRHSSLIQPPVLALSLESIYATTGDMGLLRELAPGVQRYYDWLGRSRALSDSSLIAIFSPYESGLDNSPSYDELFGLRNPGRIRILYENRKLDFLNLLGGGNMDERKLFDDDRFVVYDTLVNTYYAEGLRSLARMHATLGDDESADAAGERARVVEEELNERCWDESSAAFLHLAGKHRRPLKVLSASSLLPAFLECTPEQRTRRVVEQHIRNPETFGTPLPIPSVAASEPSFDPVGERMLWRGPVCMNINWLIVRGLRRKGFVHDADLIRGRSRAAVNEHGFREFYNPLTASGMRGRGFGWATLVVDMD
ncbi:MAG: amylo-alpha-1,6-glucosidase [Chloroflexota bacterium]